MSIYWVVVVVICICSKLCCSIGVLDFYFVNVL